MTLFSNTKYLVRNWREMISNDRFLEQADGKDRNSYRKRVPADGDAAAFRKLRHDFPVVNNWSRDQLRKKTNEKHVVQWIKIFEVATICVNNEGDLLKRKKRYREGQNDGSRI